MSAVPLQPNAPKSIKGDQTPNPNERKDQPHVSDIPKASQTHQRKDQICNETLQWRTWLTDLGTRLHKKHKSRVTPLKLRLLRILIVSIRSKETHQAKRELLARSPDPQIWAHRKWGMGHSGTAGTPKNVEIVKGLSEKFSPLSSLQTIEMVASRVCHTSSNLANRVGYTFNFPIINSPLVAKISG